MRMFMIVMTMLLHACCGGLAHAETYNYNTDYELVAAGQTAQVLGPQSATGTFSKGDILDRCIIVPETTGAGTVAIKDGGDTAINIFVSGTLSDLKPHVVVLGIRSVSGAWQVTTGTNVHVICTGRFK